LKPTHALARHVLYPAPGRETDVAGILELFDRHGHASYVCGGAVRDTLAGLPFNDVDFVVRADFATIRGIVRAEFGADCERSANAGFGLLKIGRDAGSEIDITMMRSPDDVGDAQRVEDIVYVPRSSLRDDARNRDLTINCVYWNMLDGFVDPLGCGVEDIASRMLVVAADPRKSRIDPRLSVRILLFAARGYSAGASAREYLALNLDRDLLRYESLDQYVAMVVRGSRDLARQVLRAAQEFSREPAALAALDRACGNV